MPEPEPYVSFRRVPASLNRAAMEEFAATLKNGPLEEVPFHCLITTDAELRRLNARFLKKDYATDVLSFEESGDVAISYPRAVAQALEFGHSVEDEIKILMLHGALHVLGMDHQYDRGDMEAAEARWRVKLNLPPTLIERARRRRRPKASPR